MISEEEKESYRQTANTAFTANTAEEKGQKRQRLQKLIGGSVISSFPEYLGRQSKTDKLRSFYYDNPKGLTDEEIGNLLYSKEEESTKKAKDLRLNLSRQGEVVQLNDERPARYGLSAKAREEVKKQFEAYLADLREAERLAEAEEEKKLLPALVREYVQARLDAAVVERTTRGTRTFPIVWSEVIKEKPRLAELLEEQPQDVVRLAEEVLREETNQEWAVAIRGFDDRSKIARIRAEQYGRLLNVHGELRSKGAVGDRASLMRYECTSCGDVVPVMPSLEVAKVAAPRRCKCGGKSFRFLDEQVVQVQPITVGEIPELLQPGEHPQTLPCLLRGGIAEELADRFTNGAPLTLTGVYLRQREPQSPDYKRVFLVLGCEEVRDEILHAPVTPEIRAEVERIRKSADPVREVSAIVFKAIVGHETAKDLLSVQAFSAFHTLLLGEPGLGKTQLLKEDAKAWPRADFYQSTNASRAGLTAAASKDEHTGRFVLEANGVARLHPNGLAAIDELDKASEDVHHSLLGIMQDRMLKVRKTNVQADIPCDVRILASANPKKNKLEVYSTWSEQVNLPAPLYDRFSFVLLFAEDVTRRTSFRDYFLRREQKAQGLSVEERLVLRELYRAAWNTRVSLADEETLAWMDRVMLAVIVPHPKVYGASYRLTETLPMLLEALCRLTGSARPGAWHFQKAEELLRRVQANHDEVRQFLAARREG